MADIQTPFNFRMDWVVKDQQSGNMLILSVYDANYMLRIRSAEHGAKAAIMKRISPYQMQFLRKAIERVMSGTPGNKLPVIFSSFDRQKKQQAKELVFTVEMDDRRCYRLHVTDVRSNRSFIFLLKGTSSITVGNDQLSESDRSAAMLNSLLEWLDVAKLYLPMTQLPYDPSKKSGGGGNWKGGNNGNNRGGYGNNGGGNGGGNGWGNNGGGYNNRGNGGGGNSFGGDDSDDLPI